jgi:hypothetical protein
MNTIFSSFFMLLEHFSYTILLQFIFVLDAYPNLFGIKGFVVVGGGGVIFVLDRLLTVSVQLPLWLPYLVSC